MPKPEVTLREAKRLIAELEAMQPGPYLIRGYDEYHDPPLVRAVFAPTAPTWKTQPHPTLLEAYREYRRHVPDADRRHILIESNFDPERSKIRPGNPVLLDTAIVAPLVRRRR